MPSLYYLTMALAATTSVIASPVQIEKRGFSINQVAHGTFRKNGPEQIIRTLRKFNKPVPAYLLAAVENSQTVSVESSGSAPANPSDSNDSSYLTPVTVGSKTLNLDFDTGSSDLWVYSSLQAASQRSGHNYYQTDASKLKQGYTWKISYGDGSGASGKVYADKVVVGGVTATSQAVEAATSVSSSFSQDRNTDGLLGLAMSSLNTVKPQQQKTFFDTVIPQLDKPLFAVTLKYHAAGSYDFGYIDSSKYTGSINYVNADTSQGWWGISTTGYTIAGKKYSGSSSGILDTGTTLMYVDASIASNYYSQVDGAQNDSSQGGYTFPCDAQLPDFGIIVGGVNQVVPGKYINYAPVDSSGQTCFGGMQPNDSVGFSIFGDIFLKSKYIVHEMGSTPRIGFAQQAGV